MPISSNVDGGSALLTPGLSAGSLNADLVPETDVQGYKWISLYIGAASYTGVLSYQASFDLNQWDDIPLLSMSSLDIQFSGTSTSSTGVYVGTPVWFPYFRVRMTSYSSGGATGILGLFRDGLPGLQMLNISTRLFLGHQYVGYHNNDGTATAAIAASTAGNTVVYNQGGSMLARVLVTATGTNSMLIYDNATTNAGTIIGVIPANPTAGSIYEFHMPAANGITVAGNGNNPGVTISYAQLV